MDAVPYRQKNVGKILLKNNARIELRNNFQQSALDIAKNLELLSIIDILVQRDGNLAHVIQSQNLIKAIKLGDLREVKKLIFKQVSFIERIPNVGSFDDYYTSIGIASRSCTDS